MRLGSIEINRRGTALILAVGVLSVLAIIATSFAFNMRIEARNAYNYLNGIKAKYLAEAGIADAIAQLRQDARTNFSYNDNVSSITASPSGITGNYAVLVVDEQRRINLNNANRQLLKNLLGDANYTRADAIITARTVKAFNTKDEVKLVSGVGQITYNAIKDYATVNSYADPSASNRSPVNINTASDKALESVLVGVSDGTNPTAANVASLITDIKNGRPFSPPNGWARFNTVVDASALSAAEKSTIKDNCNPNNPKPANNTTEFCFNSGGIYTISTTAQIERPAGTVVAERRIIAIAKIYEQVSQTNKSDFEGDNGDMTPVAFRVTTQDSCPIEPLNSSGTWDNPSAYKVIPNSIKLGFWDNFDTDVGGVNAKFYTNTAGWLSEGAGVRANWITRNGAFGFVNIGGNIKLKQSIGSYNPITELVGKSCTWNTPDTVFNWNEYAIRTQFENNFNPKDVPDPGAPPATVNAAGDPTGNHFGQWGNWWWSKYEWPYRWKLPPWHVGYFLFNSGPGTVGNEEKVFIRQEYTGENAYIPGPLPQMSGGMFSIILNDNNGPAINQYNFQSQGTPDTHYHKKRDLLLIASGTGVVNVSGGPSQSYGYWLATNRYVAGSPLGWNWLDWKWRVSNKYGVVGIMGNQDWSWDYSQNNNYRQEIIIDNIRIIPRSPGDYDNDSSRDDYAYFESEAISLSYASAIQWGTVSGTVTLAATGTTGYALDNVFFQVNTGSGWYPAGAPGVNPGSITNAGNSQSVSWRANFQILNDPDNNPQTNVASFPYYGDAVALEDITITYLPQTRILYWRESTE